jgi:uncharacterized protein (TIGR03084 family)
LDRTGLRGDVAAERAELAALLELLPDDGWTAPTPAAPWSVRDQVVHLGHFDHLAAQAGASPEEFAAEKERAFAALDAYEASWLSRAPSAPGAAVLQWWREAAARFDAVFATLPDRDRVPWFGPDMSVASMLSARLMETWAHGQDICDALGVERAATARLRHVAHIAVRARPFSYAVRGLPVPSEPVRVELDAPDGDRWVFAPEGEQRVTGPALDFCLVLTKRRHPDETALAADGPLARQWLEIGQAYAGPPADTRPPGAWRSAPARDR